MAGSCTVQQRPDQVVLTPHTDQGDTHQPSYYTDICEIWYNEIDNHITQLRYFITRYFTVDVSKLNVFFTSFIDIYTLKISCYIKVLYLVTDLPTHSQIATIWRLDQSPWLQWLAGALNIVWVTAVKTPAQDKKFPIVAGLLLAAAAGGWGGIGNISRPSPPGAPGSILCTIEGWGWGGAIE